LQTQRTRLRPVRLTSGSVGLVPAHHEEDFQAGVGSEWLTSLHHCDAQQVGA
jgi:hypothetical protein